jgi:nucleoside-diphosphate-sugar epimerase
MQVENKLKILITGGNGYIGKSLFNALKDKHEVTCISREDFDLSNFEDTKDFFKYKYFDVLIHCAITGGSRLKEDTIDTFDNNLRMYYNLLNNQHCYGKFINFGSGAEYNNPDSFYGKSKSIISESIKYKSNFYNIIIYAVFDENELDTRFIKANIKRYINNEPMLVSSNKKMTFFYMQDLIKLVNHIIDTEPKKLFHLNWASYIESYSLLEIANIINCLGDYKVDIYRGDSSEGDYVSNFNAEYSLNYIGLMQGIKLAYEKLKTKK